MDHLGQNTDSNWFFLRSRMYNIIWISSQITKEFPPESTRVHALSCLCHCHGDVGPRRRRSHVESSQVQLSWLAWVSQSPKCAYYWTWLRFCGCMQQACSFYEMIVGSAMNGIERDAKRTKQEQNVRKVKILIGKFFFKTLKELDQWYGGKTYEEGKDKMMKER